MTKYVYITSNAYFVTPLNSNEVTRGLYYIAFSIGVDKEPLVMIIAIQPIKEVDDINGIVSELNTIFGISIITPLEANQKYLYSRSHQGITPTGILEEVEKKLGITFFHKEKTKAIINPDPGIISPITEWGHNTEHFKFEAFLKDYEQAKLEAYFNEGLNIMKYPCGGAFAYATWLDKNQDEYLKEFFGFVTNAMNQKFLGISVDIDKKLTTVKFRSPISFNQSGDHYSEFAAVLCRLLSAKYPKIKFSWKSYID